MPSPIRLIGSDAQAVWDAFLRPEAEFRGIFPNLSAAIGCLVRMRLRGLGFDNLGPQRGAQWPSVQTRPTRQPFLWRPDGQTADAIDACSKRLSRTQFVSETLRGGIAEWTGQTRSDPACIVIDGSVRFLPEVVSTSNAGAGELSRRRQRVACKPLEGGFASLLTLDPMQEVIVAGVPVRRIGNLWTCDTDVPGVEFRLVSRRDGLALEFAQQRGAIPTVQALWSAGIPRGAKRRAARVPAGVVA